MNQSEKFRNRELSWLAFNERVLSEAKDKHIPLMERLKFLSITASNLDEFFMIRVASLKDQVNAGYTKKDISGMTSAEQIDAILKETHKFAQAQYNTYNRSFLPALKKAGLKIVTEYEELTEDIKQFDGTIIPSVSGIEQQFMLDEEGNGILDENGVPVMENIAVRTKIPYYKPNCFPLVLRRNVSRSGKFLGFSDAQVIIDQQDAVKKLGSKVQEKILGCGSVVTLPKGLNITLTDEEYRVVRINNPAEMQQINVLNLEADVSSDLRLLEYNYDWARSSLGITDSFQGKYDSSARSGTAKQYAINQAAGRLESKRVMKNTAYAKLYEMMFKFMLAYADQPIPLSKKDAKGEYSFSHFNRYDFLKQDAAGEWYWDDEFIIETDPTSTIMMNREAMWQQADYKLQSGAFGQQGDLQTLLLYWEFMEKNDYPNAAEIKRSVEKRYQEQLEQQQAMLQQQMQQTQFGGGDDEMPVM